MTGRAVEARSEVQAMRRMHPKSQQHPAPAGGEGLARDELGQVVRLRPLRVLVLSADRCFRAATTMLLTRRGCEAFAAGEVEAALAERVVWRPDVLLLERPADAAGKAWSAWRAQLIAELSPVPAPSSNALAPAALVVVAENPGTNGGEHELEKWGPFEALYDSVVLAERRRTLPRHST